MNTAVEGALHKEGQVQSATIPSSSSSARGALHGARDGEFLDLNPAQLLRRLHTVDWTFEIRQPDSALVHGIHPYPAKFVPELPRRVIGALSMQGELVVDPFSGGGTAAVEALRSGRAFYGIDANPIGNILARAKTTPLSSADFSALRSLEATLMAMQPGDLLRLTPRWLPHIPNREKWYDIHVFRALGVIRDAVAEVTPRAARDLAFVAFAQAASKLSFQESETRYVSAPREIDRLEVPQTALRELRRIRRLCEGRELTGETSARLIEGDSRDPASFDLSDGSAGLVVTSPPYPNTYDYHLYHRFRLFWLGEDPTALRRVEIGSHLKNQGRDDPIQDYLDDMGAVLRNCLRILADGRMAVVIIGTGLFRGEIFDTAAALTELGIEHGYDHIATINRPLPQHRRSITRPGRRLTSEQILFLRKPLSRRTAIAIAPNYSLHPYEEILQVRELHALGGSPSRAADGTIEVAPTAALERTAFTHEISGSRGCHHTLQRKLELAADRTSKRKNSIYGAHSIHRYKGKFYPQLAKALINISGVEPGESLICDPFGGSGTVAAEAVANGLEAVSIDWNPVAVASSRAKVALSSAAGPAIVAEVTALRGLVERAPTKPPAEFDQFAAATVEELGSWFPGSVLAKLNWLLRTIREQTDGDARVVMEVITSDLIREISHQEPRDLRIRRRKIPLSDAPVYELFCARASAVEARSARLHSACDPSRLGTATILEADAGDIAAFDPLAGRKIDAVVSSPPYATALPYLDTDRLSLAAIFGYGVSERRELERQMIGSREIGKRELVELESKLTDASAQLLPTSTREFLVDLLAAVKLDDEAGFRRRQTPAVLFRYFCAMRRVIGNLVTNMSPGAACWLVLGDSRSTIGGRTRMITTVDEVAAISVDAGLSLVDRIPITVTRENLVHARHSITRNEILELRLEGSA